MNSDDQQYQRFLDGDIRGFEDLVLTHKDHLIYFINRYVPDLHEAEDLAQDVFVDIYLYKERFHFKNSFKTYLYTIGRNKAVDFIRKQKKQIPVMDMDVVLEQHLEEQDLLDQILWKEEQQVLMDGIKQLKPEYQALITLIDLEELSYQEAAKIVHKTVPQVKVTLHRARKALKEHLHERQ